VPESGASLSSQLFSKVLPNYRHQLRLTKLLISPNKFTNQEASHSARIVSRHQSIYVSYKKSNLG